MKIEKIDKEDAIDIELTPTEEASSSNTKSDIVTTSDDNKKALKPIDDDEKRERELNADFDFARKAMKNALEQGSLALNDMLILAQSMDHPRAYEVFGQLMKGVVESSREYVALHEGLKNAKPEGQVAGPKSQTNIAFIGSTHELQKILKGKIDLKDINYIENDED